ncbi:hypothetical protein C4D60_Mb02t13900 [Musa balbisiana]|uniref:Uncharacterized protein n=1 Tax=Musa balbisiana TaxID=52838 RepID=A0A4S8IAP3_MUSBA|nr:hypothetical protein C4D60_Mb02t13900 [Musa balbisiana]
MMEVGCNPIDLRLRLGSSSRPNSGFADSSEHEMARNIISMAEREMDDQMRKKNQQSSLLSPQQKPDSAELSMIRSLQQFLQNRKSRLSSLPPYNHRLHPMFPVK